MKDIMVVCKKCGNKAAASSLRLDLDEKLMICPECVKNKKIHKEIKETIFQKGIKIKEVKDIIKERPSKMAHKCSSCGYTFRINLETKTPKNCPYCDKKILGSYSSFSSSE